MALLRSEAPLAAMFFGLLVACADAPTDDDTDVEAAPTFAEVQEILNPSCGFSICHGGSSGDLTLDGTPADHGRLVGVEADAKPGAILVVAGDADASYLIQKLEGAAGIEGDAMPPGAPLSEEKIARLRAWIDAGALE